MLITVAEFRRLFAPSSRPTRKTVVRWIQGGVIAGRRIGGKWYVDPDLDPPAARRVDKPQPKDDAIRRRAAEILTSTPRHEPSPST